MLTPEALNDRLLAQVAQLERELAELRATVAVGRPELPTLGEIVRVRRAAHEALVSRASIAGDTRAAEVATDFLRIFDILYRAAKQ